MIPSPTLRRVRFAERCRRFNLLAFMAAALAVVLAVPYAACRADEEKPAGKPEKKSDDDAWETQIFVANADGSDPKRLTTLPEWQSQGSASWSADGRFVAFDAWRPQLGEKGSAARVLVVGADGKNARVFGDGAMPSLSPKGNRFAYCRYGKGVWVQNTNDPDEPPAQLDGNGWGTDWSPDGTRIAWTRGPQLVVYDIVEGTVSTLLGPEPRFRQIFWNFCWTGDSKRIVFKATQNNGKAGVFSIDARGEKEGLDTLLESQTVGPAFASSPDAKRLLLSDTCTERNNLVQLFSLPTTPGGKPELQTKFPKDHQLTDPAFSPDGKKVAFSWTRIPAKP